MVFRRKILGTRELDHCPTTQSRVVNRAQHGGRAVENMMSRSLKVVTVGLVGLALAAGCPAPKTDGETAGETEVAVRSGAVTQAPRGVLELQHGQAMRSRNALTAASAPAGGAGPPAPARARRRRNALTAASAPAGAHLQYFGGRVVSNIQVVQVIWGTGSYIPEVLSTASPSMATFYQGVLNS